MENCILKLSLSLFSLSLVSLSSIEELLMMSNDTQAVLDLPRVGQQPIEARPANGSKPHAPPIVEVRDLRKVFVKRKVNPAASRLARLTLRNRISEPAVAVERVSFSINEGEI